MTEGWGKDNIGKDGHQYKIEFDFDNTPTDISKKVETEPVDLNGETFREVARKFGVGPGITEDPKRYSLKDGVWYIDKKTLPQWKEYEDKLYEKSPQYQYYRGQD